MANYNRWTKDALIKRVKQLEDDLKNVSQAAFSQPPHSASEHEHGAVQTLVATSLHSGDADTSTLAHAPAAKTKREPKSIDFSKKWATRFIALKLAYIGKKYNGFEYQCTGAQTTIEEELWKALVKSCLIIPDPERPNEVDWNVCEYSKCGRTDRGVSAFGQVVALRVRSNKPAATRPAAPSTGHGAEAATVTNHPSRHEKERPMDEATKTAQEGDDVDDTPLPTEQEIQYCRVLNRILPPDIRVYAWCPNPPPDFSARFSCRERQYRYFFTQPAFAPLPHFLENLNSTSVPTTKHKDGWLDIAAMRKAAKLFEGLHDFRNFCKIDPSKQITNFQRRIFEADIVEVDGVDNAIPYLSSPPFCDPNTPASSAPKVYYFHVRGSAFLWHQIRCMVAVLFLIGQGHESSDVITQLLDTRTNPGRPTYAHADDAPLVLCECLFGRDNDDGAADEVDWLYVGSAPGDNPLHLHGGSGLADELWAFWRERKMDEIIANRLLDWVSRKTAITDAVPPHRLESLGKSKAVKSTRVYEGGNTAKRTGTWLPIMENPRMRTPEEMNDRFAVRNGFHNAEQMRARGNWRDAISEAKNKEKKAAMDTAED